jgi:crossover junction endodeoxyribonuclease RuvC
MLARMFKLENIPKNLDATDGLAVAVCHFYQSRLSTKKSGSDSWEVFVKKNPGRVR